MKERKEFNPGDIAHIKGIIKRRLNLDFSALLAACKSNPESFTFISGKQDTEKDLIKEIVYEGNLQLGANAGFDEIIIEGTKSIAAALGLS